MMRLLILLILLIFIAFGAVFGALNADMVSYDLFYAHVSIPKGAALLGALLAGWLLGGLLVWLFAVAPARRHVRRAQRAQAGKQAVVAESPPA